MPQQTQWGKSNFQFHRQNFRMFLKGQKVSEGNCGDYNFQKQTKKK